VEEWATPTEILEWLLSEIKEEGKKELRERIKEPGGMVIFHPVLGRAVRNRFKLWDEKNPYTKVKDCEEKDGTVIDPMHPDNFSGKILEAFWRCVVDGVSPSQAAQDL
jgi:hypothetical protein